MNGALTDVPGLAVGHHTDADGGSGCTAALALEGATGGVDVRGASPGTRETDLLRAENTVEAAHAIVLSGGSAYGLASASGAMRLLEERGVGHRVGSHIVPIVPAAIIFDLGVGRADARPGPEDGYAAASRASTSNAEQGSVGAGTGATVGKALGRERAMKGGLGCASMDLGEGVVLAAMTVVNAVGGVHDPETGRLLAGPRGDDGFPVDSVGVYADPGYGRNAAAPASLGNTTIGIVACNARLTKAQANRLATVAHDGLALAIRPAHTTHDGDTMFALATGGIDAPEEFPRLCALTPTVVARSIVAAIRNATGLHGFPSASELLGDG